MKKYILTERDLRRLLLMAIIFEALEKQSHVDLNEVIDQLEFDIDKAIDGCVSDFLEYKE